MTDRVVQSAVKQLLEHILEARFRHVSYGFRPGRGCHGALEHIRMTWRPRRVSKIDGLRHETPYPWVIEGDIKCCFDNIDHHRLMQRMREHCADRRVNRLLVQFLKAGVLSEEPLLPTIVTVVFHTKRRRASRTHVDIFSNTIFKILH